MRPHPRLLPGGEGTIQRSIKLFVFDLVSAFPFHLVIITIGLVQCGSEWTLPDITGHELSFVLERAQIRRET
jgi:hypothetical protein